jgi:hypothetical protein
MLQAPDEPEKASSRMLNDFSFQSAEIAIELPPCRAGPSLVRRIIETRGWNHGFQKR